MIQRLQSIVREAHEQIARGNPGEYAPLVKDLDLANDNGVNLDYLDAEKMEDLYSTVVSPAEAEATRLSRLSEIYQTLCEATGGAVSLMSMQKLTSPNALANARILVSHLSRYSSSRIPQPGTDQTYDKLVEAYNKVDAFISKALGVPALTVQQIITTSPAGLARPE